MIDTTFDLTTWGTFTHSLSDHAHQVQRDGTPVEFFIHNRLVRWSDRVSTVITPCQGRLCVDEGDVEALRAEAQRIWWLWVENCDPDSVLFGLVDGWGTEMISLAKSA